MSSSSRSARIGGLRGRLGVLRVERRSIESSHRPPGEPSGPGFIAFLISTCGLLTKHSVDGSIHFICMDWRHTVELLAAGSQVYSELKNISVWVKNNAGMGSLYRSQHEFVLVYKSGTAPHTNNIALGKYGRHRTNVCYDGASTQARK